MVEIEKDSVINHKGEEEIPLASCEETREKIGWWSHFSLFGESFHQNELPKFCQRLLISVWMLVPEL